MPPIRSLLVVAATLATTTALADEDNNNIRFKDPAMNAYAAFAKIEANLSEASAKLYLHAALPADNDARKGLASAVKDDVATIEHYTAVLEKAKLSGKAADEFDEFQEGWPEAKELTEKLTKASAENPASAKELLAHHEAFDELDDSVDEALQALAEAADRS